MWRSPACCWRRPKQRFPHAEIVFVGPRKNYELFAGRPAHRVTPPWRTGAAACASAWPCWDELRSAARRARRGRDRPRFPPDATRPAAGVPGGSLPPLRKPRLRRRRRRAAARAGRAPGPRRRSASRGARPYVALGAPAGARPAHRREPGSRREPGQAPSRSVRRGAAARCSRGPALPLVHRSRAPAAKKPSASSGPWSARGVTRAVLGGLVRRIRGDHRRQPPLCRLRFRRPARGRRLRRAAGQHLRRLPRAAHVRALAARRRALDRDPRGPPRRWRRFSNRCGGAVKL